MLIGVVLGLAFGVLGASSVLIAALATPSNGSADGVTYGSFVLFYVAVLAGPGAAIGSLLLSLVWRWRQRRGASRLSLRILACTIGPALGVVNLVIVLLAAGGWNTLREMSRSGEVHWWIAGLAGGLGVGVGSLWAVPKQEPRP
jgi:hypothetical protein